MYILHAGQAAPLRCSLARGGRERRTRGGWRVSRLDSRSRESGRRLGEWRILSLEISVIASNAVILPQKLALLNIFLSFSYRTYFVPSFSPSSSSSSCASHPPWWPATTQTYRNTSRTCSRIQSLLVYFLSSSPFSLSLCKIHSISKNQLEG